MIVGQKQKLMTSYTLQQFKIYLQKNDESAAMNQMQAMVNCLDFNPEFFTLSAHEAMACRALPVAIASLSNLLNQYSPGKPMPMPEVAVLRNVIVLLFQISDSQPEILKFMRRAHTRMSELGTEQFFGNGVVGNRELNWFAGNSWNMGIKTGTEKQYEFCADFFELASEFFSAMGGDEIDGGNHAMICKSLILSVAGMINGEKQRKAALTDFEVKRGIEMLDRAGKILTSTMKATQSASDQPTTDDSSLFFLHTLNAYHLYDRLDNDKRSQQLYLIKSFASLKACTPQNLLQIGLTASHGLNSNPEAAHFAFNACLTAHLASASPDYHKIALVVRKLAVLTGSRDGDVDNEAYAAYRQAYRIMVGLKEGEYPSEEGKWLATTAWNRSVLPGRLGQVDMARRWMKMGLELARCVPGMEGYKGCMEECLAGIEKLGGDGGRDGEGGESESRNQLLL